MKGECPHSASGIQDFFALIQLYHIHNDTNALFHLFILRLIKFIYLELQPFLQDIPVVVIRSNLNHSAYRKKPVSSRAARVRVPYQHNIGAKDIFLIILFENVLDLRVIENCF